MQECAENILTQLKSLRRVPVLLTVKISGPVKFPTHISVHYEFRL
jgi:hypothetical protein